MKIKILTLLAVITISFSVNAGNFNGNLELAKKSHQLSIRMNELSTIENVPFCKNTIHEAATLTEMAAVDFMSDVVGLYSGRIELRMAIQALAYTAVENCSQADNILATKNEAEQIYDSIII